MLYLNVLKFSFVDAYICRRKKVKCFFLKFCRKNIYYNLKKNETKFAEKTTNLFSNGKVHYDLNKRALRPSLRLKQISNLGDKTKSCNNVYDKCDKAT
jgi:hypothetical protein